MLKENLYEEVLLKPAVDIKADGLLIVSAFAFSSMALRHIKGLRRFVKTREFNLKLIVDMVPAKSLQRRDHEGFVILSEQVDSLNLTAVMCILVKPYILNCIYGLKMSNRWSLTWDLQTIHK